MNLKPSNLHSNGKLLLTGEYFVLDGALALALPTKLGQSLQIIEKESVEIHWTSYDSDNSIWFEGVFALAPSFSPKGEAFPMNETAARLTQIFQSIEKQKPDFFQQFRGLQIETRLDFPREWGLGTSSTLLANLAQWAKIDAFLLLKDTFGGSGYDIACATANGPILYQFEKRPTVQNRRTLFKNFAHQLYFVYLGKKQDSRQGIAHYRQKVKDEPELVKQISDLTRQFIDCKNLSAFEDLIQQHEALISETLELPRAKELHFFDYWGEIKSLGAWGGDFILATSNRNKAETKFYFNERGFETVILFEQLVF